MCDVQTIEQQAREHSAYPLNTGGPIRSLGSSQRATGVLLVDHCQYAEAADRMQAAEAVGHTRVSGSQRRTAEVGDIP